MNRFNGPFVLALCALILALAIPLPAANSPAPTTPDDDKALQQRLEAFAQKMRDANYPPLFDKAAQEFNVPPDILKGVSFAETRWTQLTWPPAETASPETGMPRPFGIMSLWDNQYFGHSLIEAAKLIGQDPELLKTDAFQNMRGGAALLRKLYDSTPRPADATGDELESWRKAIAQYTGIPQVELREQHALRVFEYINNGYHQYGIEWDGHPVNLGPMRADVARIRAEAQARALADDKSSVGTTGGGATNLPLAVPAAVADSAAGSATNSSGANKAPTLEVSPESQIRQRWILLGLMVFLLAIAAVYLRKRRDSPGAGS